MSCRCAKKPTPLGVLLQGYDGMGSLAGRTGAMNDYDQELGFYTPALTGVGDIYLSGVEDSLWPTTGDINTETASLETTVQNLGQDILLDQVSASDPNWQVFQNKWNAFVADFDQWRNASWFWNPTRRDDLLSYRSRFNSLLDQYHGINGAVTTGVSAVKGASPSPGPFDSANQLLGHIATGAVIVGAIYAGAKLLPMLRGMGKVRNPRRRRRR